MKEVFNPGNHRDRQFLRASPVHDIAEGHGVILLTMDDQRARVQVLWNGCHRKPAGGSADQHDAGQRALRCKLRHRMAGNECTKRKACQRQIAARPLRYHR